MHPPRPDSIRARIATRGTRHLALVLALATSGAASAGDPCAAGDGPNFAVSNSGATSYLIDGVNDPALTVVRGCTYTFTVNASGHPFLIKSVQGPGLLSTYDNGVTNQGVQNGVLTWQVPLSAPNTLFYNCQFHASMTGTITVIDAPPPEVVFADGFEDVVR